MEKIASFQVDHTRLKRGMYISRVDFTDIVTYDIRMKEPNHGDYLSNGASHTFEHLFATYVRSSRHKSKIIYAGPMGCMTGCYFVTKGLDHAEAITLVREAMAFIRDFEGEIPGAAESECGNYRLHDLPDAKKEADAMARVLAGWTADRLQYEAYRGEKVNYTY